MWGVFLFRGESFRWETRIYLLAQRGENAMLLSLKGTVTRVDGSARNSYPIRTSFPHQATKSLEVLLIMITSPCVLVLYYSN